MKPLKSWKSLPIMPRWRTDSAMQATIIGCCPCSAWILLEVRHLYTLHYSFYCRVWWICLLLLIVFSTSNSGSEDQRNGMLKKFEHFQHLAELYHVYHSIQRFMVSPAAAVDLNFSHSGKKWEELFESCDCYVIWKHFRLLKMCPFQFRLIF